MTTREIRQHCQLSDAGMNLLRTSIQEMGLSARAHDKILRVARTIADLDGRAEILPEHVSEAVNYRMLDRQFWSYAQSDVRISKAGIMALSRNCMSCRKMPLLVLPRSSAVLQTI